MSEAHDLKQAIIGCKAYLATGKRCAWTIPKQGKVECVRITGTDAVAEVRRLFRQLAKAVAAACKRGPLAPVAEMLLSELGTFPLLERDPELNTGLPFSIGEASGKSGPFAEHVRLEALDTLDRALSRLSLAETSTSAGQSANGSPKSAGGRPSVPEQEAQKRKELVERWRRARAAGVCQKDFCSDKAVSLEYLTKCINWVAQRRRRSGDS